MTFHRIQNPASPDEMVIASVLKSGVEVVILQFSEASAYNEKILDRVNAMCERFGSRLNIRFYGHYGSGFNCENLRHLPLVRSLNIDCLMDAIHLECLDELAFLEEFAFGVFRADVPRLLESGALTNLRKLVLIETHKNDVDLAPLASYVRLEELLVNGHTRHIDSLGTLPKLQKLSLRGIGKKTPVSFLRSIACLKSLTYILGGRMNVDDLEHDGLERLEIVRVLGLSEINLALFPKLERLTVEDQLRLNELDIRPLRKLQRLSVFNCKKLTRLVGLDSAKSLESLRIGMTDIELNEVLNDLPASVKALTLHSPRKAIDDRVQRQVTALALPNAYYTAAP